MQVARRPHDIHANCCKNDAQLPKSTKGEQHHRKQKVKVKIKEDYQHKA